MMSAVSMPIGEATIGPFFPGAYVDAGANDLTRWQGRSAQGQLIDIRGRVTEDEGVPLQNVVLEIWQADANGIYRHPADPRAKHADADFFGWGRAATDADGAFHFRTIMPGRTHLPNGTLRAPHINVVVLASGLMRQLQTVMFFEGNAANATDAVLACVHPAAFQEALIAKADGPRKYRFDIRLCGADETPFFED
ncbi:MAG: protocatechuate 3,4-dioxygenase subunit alpha [Betaproteobacteria bacterium]|nr:protocatechuate 3,4-dioxygenase subunit alpha [Betaproteobacteria bacterium]